MVMNLLDAAPEMRTEVLKILHRLKWTYEQTGYKLGQVLLDKIRKMSRSDPSKDATEREVMMLFLRPRITDVVFMMATIHSSRIEKGMLQ